MNAVATSSILGSAREIANLTLARARAANTAVRMSLFMSRTFVLMMLPFHGQCTQINLGTVTYFFWGQLNGIWGTVTYFFGTVT